jgi:hypothetical protein
MEMKYGRSLKDKNFKTVNKVGSYAVWLFAREVRFQEARALILEEPSGVRRQASGFLLVEIKFLLAIADTRRLIMQHKTHEPLHCIRTNFKTNNVITVHFHTSRNN